MAAGSIVNGQCVENALAAASYWSRTEPRSSFSGADNYISFVSLNGTAWTNYVFKNGAYFTSSPVPAIASPTCNTADKFTDGMQLGWGIAAAMVVAWGITVLRRGI